MRQRRSRETGAVGGNVAPDLRGSVHEEEVAWFREARGETAVQGDRQDRRGRRGLRQARLASEFPGVFI